MAAEPSTKSLWLRRPDRCVSCGQELAAGERAVWDAIQRVVTCLECPRAQLKPDNGVPGASARREYDRRRASREEHARQKLGILGVGLARLTDEPASTTAWKRGAEGEERVGARLVKLLSGSGVRPLHDRRVPGSGSANIDHIAVGPGGVTVIDAKNIRGKVRKERVGGLFVARHDVLLIDGRDRTALVTKVEGQIAAVRRALDTAAVDLDVRGALCFADVDGLPLLRSLTVNGVAVDGPKPVARLARRPGALTPERVEELWMQLARALPAA